MGGNLRELGIACSGHQLTISADPREHLLEAMRERLKTDKGKQMKKALSIVL